MRARRAHLSRTTLRSLAAVGAGRILESGTRGTEISFRVKEYPRTRGKDRRDGVNHAEVYGTCAREGRIGSVHGIRSGKRWHQRYVRSCKGDIAETEADG